MTEEPGLDTSKLDQIAASLAKLLPQGLPATEDDADELLLGLPGVIARSIDPDDVLSRVKALNDLLVNEIVVIPSRGKGDWAAGAVILFKLTRPSTKWKLVERYTRAATATSYGENHYRTEIVPQILKQLARQLYNDSQKYTARNGRALIREASGSTPIIAETHFTTRERAELEEHQSRLWEYVYGLRAELIAMERFKAWPENENNDFKLLEARDSALWQVARLMEHISQYVERYSEPVFQGKAEFTAESLIRLAGWRGSLPEEFAQRLRLFIAQYPDRNRFVSAVYQAGLMDTIPPDSEYFSEPPTEEPPTA